MDMMSINNQIFSGQNEMKTAAEKAGKDDISKEDLKKVAQEMESVFAYQLIKVMRDTSKSITGGTKGLGNDTYMGLFDMEMSKLFAERGLGLQDMLVKQLGRMSNPENNEK